MHGRVLEAAAVEALDPARCSEADWEGCYALNRAAHAEGGTFPMSPRAYRSSHFAPHDGLERQYWVARAGGAIVGKLDLTQKPGEPTLAGLGLHVDTAQRRRGVARALVQHALGAPQAGAVQTLWAGALHATGRAACEHLGGEVALVGAQRFLKLADVDWEAVEHKRAQGALRFADTELLELDRVPEALVDAYLATRNAAWADQPRPAGRPKDLFTLEHQRAEERSFEARGWQWRLLLSVEPDGSVSGMTDVHYDPATPTLIRQQFTGVAPERRGRGLATWLKTEMLTRVRDRYPAVRCMSTNNGADNAPMLAINQRLGFGDPVLHHTYRFDVPDLRARLGV